MYVFPPSSSSSSSGSPTGLGGQERFRHSRVLPKGTYPKYSTKRDSIGGIAYAPAYGYVSEEGRACKSVALRKIFSPKYLLGNSYRALGRGGRIRDACIDISSLARSLCFFLFFRWRFTDKDSVSPAVRREKGSVRLKQWPAVMPPGTRLNGQRWISIPYDISFFFLFF